MLNLKDLTKYYRNIPAVDGIDLNLDHPGIFGLLGPNGSGKSTIMKMICGAIAPTRGSVSICGFDLSVDPIAAKKRLGYLQETSLLYKELKVKNYLSMVATLKRIPKSEIKVLVEDVIASCSLGAVINKTIGSVSKGYRQRVAIAQAILGGPEVLLMDEPTSSLDPVQSHDINDLIKDISSKSLVFLSTHLVSEASKICDKIFILQSGRITDTLGRSGDGLWIGKEKTGSLDDIILSMFR